MSLQNSQNLPDATLVLVWCGRLVIGELLIDSSTAISCWLNLVG